MPNEPRGQPNKPRHQPTGDDKDQGQRGCVDVAVGEDMREQGGSEAAGADAVYAAGRARQDINRHDGSGGAEPPENNGLRAVDRKEAERREGAASAR